MPGACRLDSVQLLCGSDVYNHGIFYNARILACHASVAELESAFDANYCGNIPDTVMSRSPLDLQWQNNNWHGLGFDAPWQHNGSDNYIIEFRWQGDDNNSVYDRGWYTTGNRAVNASSSTAVQGVPRNYMPRFRIFYEASGIEGSVPVGPESGQRLRAEPSVVTSGFVSICLARPPSRPTALSVSDLSGRVLISRWLTGPADRVRLDVGSLSPGPYLCRLSAGPPSNSCVLLIPE